jgi:succinate dehydrogenase / fumarate reductase membrane anchor subunit
LKLISPLNAVLGLGSAKDGSEHWWSQRLTAIALVPLGLWLALSLGALVPLSYETVVTWMRQPITSILMLLTVSAALYHSYLGIQVVVEDYVHGAAKTAMLILSAFAHLFLAVAAVFSILKVAFGAPS